MYRTLRYPLALACRSTWNAANSQPLLKKDIFLTHSRSSLKSWFKPLHPRFGFTTFKLADIGEGITEVELLNWSIKEGDLIEEMGEVCVVQSDKSAVEISSPLTGSVKKLYHKVGDIIKIGSPLMDIQLEGEEEGTATATQESPGVAQEEEATNQGSAAAEEVPRDETPLAPKVTPGKKKSGKWKASPAVRALARKHQIDLKDVYEGGSGDIITAEDVLGYLESKPKKKEEGVKDTSIKSSAKETSSPSLSKDKKNHETASSGKEYEEILLTSPVSKGMVKSMNQSLTVPYMSLQEDIDITDLLKARVEMNTFMKSAGLDCKLTVTSLIIKAVSKALTLVPILNSKFDTVTMDRYKLYSTHNVSLAIDTPHGLVVPNIKHVEKLSLRDIQKEVTHLSSLAKENRLTVSQLTGGTITLSNVGVIGSTAVRPIVFDGQACIIGIGRTQKLPRYHPHTKTLEPRDMINMTASVDHRHIDGATVARFIKTLREILENMHILSL